MPSLMKLVLFSVLSASISSYISSAQTMSPDNKSLGSVARELRAEKSAQHPNQALPSSQGSALETAAEVVNEPPEIQRFMDHAKVLLMREEFAELDHLADEVRSTKARFPGGVWKLSRFYESINSRRHGRYQTDADWQSQLNLLQRWIAARPQSITARVALAAAYLDYAWDARGSGYSNTVTDQGWQLFDQRAKKALKTLEDSETLTQHCPHWYYVMQRVGQALGADKDQQRAIFEKAAAFEPQYFWYYQEYAIILLPKWEGEPGDTEAFADEMYRHIGGKQGAYIYFEIASNLCGTCGDFVAEAYSWPRLQEGFAALQEMYGLSPLRLNRFAFLAATYSDKAAAAKAFARIGPNWDAEIWGSRGRFEAQRTWAGLPASPPAAPATLGMTPPPGFPVDQILDNAMQERAAGRWDESSKLAQQVIKILEPLPLIGEPLGRAYLLIAQNELSSGHVPEAKAMLDKAVAGVSEKDGPNSLSLATILWQTAGQEQALNDYDRAEANLRRGIEIREKTSGPSDLELIHQFTLLGDLLQTRGREKEAMDFYQRAISVGESVNPDELRLSMPIEQLGILYQKMGRNQDAETAFLRMLKIMEGSLGLNHFALTEPLTKLANLYHVTGRLDDEHRMQERLHKIQPNATH